MINIINKDIIPLWYTVISLIVSDLLEEGDPKNYCRDGLLMMVLHWQSQVTALQ